MSPKRDRDDPLGDLLRAGLLPLLRVCGILGEHVSGLLALRAEEHAAQALQGQVLVSEDVKQVTDRLDVSAGDRVVFHAQTLEHSGEKRLQLLLRAPHLLWQLPLLLHGIESFSRKCFESG